MNVSLPVLGLDAGTVRIAETLSGLIEGDVRVGRHDRLLYATDASIYQVEPLAVVIPRTIGDIATAVRFAAEAKLPVLPRGGGTSLAGQTVNTALVIDTSAWCTRIVEIDSALRCARVEPGVVLEQLNRAAAAVGLMFGPDVATSSHATIGGMIGNNSAGAHSVVYGRTVEHVLALDVMLADGRRVLFEEGAAVNDPVVGELTTQVADVVWSVADEIDTRFPKTRRRVNGYNLDLVLAQLRAADDHSRVNLAHLLCGSEGTLGVTLEAKVGLVERPASRGLAILSFATLDDALESVGMILATEPAAIELLDDVIIGLARRNLEYRHYVDLLAGEGASPAAVLYVEYAVADAATLAARRERLAAVIDPALIRWYQDPVAMTQAWKLRKAGEPLLHGQPGPRQPITFIEDTAVDPERLPEFVRRFRAIVERHGTTASYYAHASVGCLHIRPLVDLNRDDDRRMMRSIMDEVTSLVMEFGGALSGEHGDGRLRSAYLEPFFGPKLIDAFRAIKRIFDPEGRLNPGNIVDGPDPVSHLRVQPAANRLPTPSFETYFRYEADHGFEAAVHRCNGAGVCRRVEGGTMCPSYRATRDERHATRGRGNALRLAMTGQLSADGATPAFDDPETIATLDLCLSCKACKAECPSNVDIARLRSEYMAQTFDQRGGPPHAVRALAQIRRLNQLGAIAPGIANALAGSGFGRMVARRAVGVDPRRTLPRFDRGLRAWHGRRARREGPPVILYPDCFTAYTDSAVGRAAVEVLEHIGYRVVIPRVGCCGRPHISTGWLAGACPVIRRTHGDLSRVIESEPDAPIVVAEPSCLSAFIDDWPALQTGLEEETLGALTTRTHFLDDFLADGTHPRPWPDTPATPDTHLLLHGHCHQKALWGAGATGRLLSQVVTPHVETLDAGCCGMAGAFGFTETHYDLSLAIAELALLPALRAEPNARVAAPGTSCRHQIADGLGGRKALHPVEIVAEALGVS